MRTVVTTLLLSGLLCFVGSGCTDRASVARIQARHRHQAEFIADLRRTESHRHIRLMNMESTLSKWWRADAARFQEKISTAGDIIW